MPSRRASTRETRSEPTVPPPPTGFSTTTVWPSASVRPCARMRPATSLGPPAGERHDQRQRAGFEGLGVGGCGERQRGATQQGWSAMKKCGRDIGVAPVLSQSLAIDARGMECQKLAGARRCFRRAPLSNQTACKPGSVGHAAQARKRDGHSSATPVARRLKQPTRTATRTRVGAFAAPVPSLFGLAPGGVCRAASVAGSAVRSYRTVSPLPRQYTTRRGGLFSVALSLGLPPPDVIRHRLSMEPGLSSPATFRRLPERPSSRLTG